MLPQFDTTLQKNYLSSKKAKDITTQGLDIDLSPSKFFRKKMG